jgi:hypothetical protein
MVRLTLDTACVIHAAQGGRYRAEIDQLVRLAPAGKVGLWLTSAFDVDQARASDENLRANLRWLSERPLIQRGSGPFRFGLSKLGGPGAPGVLDKLVDESTAQVDEKIKLILWPSYQVGDELPVPKVNDVHHLTAHLMAGHDAFVTLDEKDILRRRQALLNDVGITVVTPAEALALVMAS